MLSTQEKMENKKVRIAVAMSGGVDSSVAASLLVTQGYEVVGLTMQLYDHGVKTAQSKSCCAGTDIYDAKRVADHLGIVHYVLNYEKTFERDVIQPFVNAYMNGETPIPCVLCNQTVKFRDLIDAAKSIGATALATGHYIRSVQTEFGSELYRAVDRKRDQSYFLFATTSEQLSFLKFPLGSLKKSETRQIADEIGLSIADKADSQDICFVPDGHYTDVIGKLDTEGLKRQGKGRLIHVDGYDIGEHKGIDHYTVGQRRGLNIGGEPAPLYVLSIHPDTNIIIVGPRECLAKSSIIIRDVNWISSAGEIPIDNINVNIRIHSAHEAVSGTIRRGTEKDGAIVTFDEPLYGLSPGQACVLYDGDQMLGGGWIVKDKNHNIIPHNKRHETSVVLG